MLFEDAAQPGFFALVDFCQGDEIPVDHFVGFAAENVGKASGHAGAEIQAERAEDEDDAAGHVFAAVLADAFDNRESAAIADGKTFTSAACDEKPAGGGAVKDGVSGENVAAAGGGGTGRDGDSSTGETLADVVVGFARERESDSIGQKRAEALARAAVKILR